MNLIVDKNIPIERFLSCGSKLHNVLLNIVLLRLDIDDNCPEGEGVSWFCCFPDNRVTREAIKSQTHHLSVSIWEMGWPMSFFKMRSHPGGCKFCVDWVSCSDSLLIQWASPFLTSDAWACCWSPCWEGERAGNSDFLRTSCGATMFPYRNLQGKTTSQLSPSTWSKGLVDWQIGQRAQRKKSLEKGPKQAPTCRGGTNQHLGCSDTVL